MHTTSHIRSAFLEYFKKQGHAVLPSSSLVPHNDPTLMFANAGMNQFKDIFTGREHPPTPPRAATSQKCVRAGGKHNDLDNVGYTARHHTFFEMLGNFSFGDYFKEGAIEHAWRLITQEYGINPQKLCVTVYHTDDEAFGLWKKIAGLPEDKIIRISTNDNFWAMGDTGPCGPCSEIFYDHGDKIPGGPPGSAEADGDRFVEIWNLVFMQYEQKDKETRIALPKPSIDTGMGLERITAVMQGVSDNYDTDIFRALIGASQDLSHNHDPKLAASHRVIADHLRSSGFLIADGVLPSNEGRGYVLRRIMRRAMRHAHILGCTEPLMHRLVPMLIQTMSDSYPELLRAQPLMTETLRQEEERFKQTLDRGLKLLEEERAQIKQGGSFSGEAAFKLYDTYGFPLDLTEDILRQDSIRVDHEAFNAAMAEQKARARAAWSGSGESAVGTLWFDIKEQCGMTEFMGYAHNTAQAQIVALVKGKERVERLGKGESGLVVTNQTPFYGESGGQVGDEGCMAGKAFCARVTDTTKPIDGLIVHHILLDDGEINIGDTVDLRVDSDRRDRIRANHSATHLLHAALRQQLGDHITQKGSLVDEDRLRFDITHPKAMTRGELDAIEREVNALIWQNTPVTTALMTPDDAIKAGAMALFGEKYGAEVRVLSMGETAKGAAYSVELCGGTHVARTGDIGLIKILSESAVAAGVRRIEAVTQGAAFAYLAEQEGRVRELALALKIKPEDVNEKVLALAEEKKKLEKQLAEAKKQLALGGGGGEEIAPETIGAHKLIAKSYPDLDPKALRDLAASLQQKHTDAIIALASGYEGKASILVAIGKQAAGSADAPSLVRIAAEAVGGKGGGGRPDMAQAGGPEGDKIDAALVAVKASLSS